MCISYDYDSSPPRLGGAVACLSGLYNPPVFNSFAAVETGPLLLNAAAAVDEVLDRDPAPAESLAILLIALYAVAKKQLPVSPQFIAAGLRGVLGGFCSEEAAFTEAFGATVSQILEKILRKLDLVPSERALLSTALYYVSEKFFSDVGSLGTRRLNLSRLALAEESIEAGLTLPEHLDLSNILPEEVPSAGIRGAGR